MKENLLTSVSNNPNPDNYFYIEGAPSYNDLVKTTGVSVQSDNSIFLDGSSAVQYIRIPNLNTPKPITNINMHARTIFSLDEAYSNTKTCRILYKFNQNSSNGAIGFAIQRTASADNLFVLVSMDNSEVVYTFPGRIAVGQLIDVTYVRDGTNKASRFYLNGNFVKEYIQADEGNNIDWMVGTYLDAGGNPILSTYAQRFKWTLHQLDIRYLP